MVVYFGAFSKSAYQLLCGKRFGFIWLDASQQSATQFWQFCVLNLKSGNAHTRQCISKTLAPMVAYNISTAQLCRLSTRPGYSLGHL
jgi:hypothetical protein